MHTSRGSPHYTIAEDTIILRLWPQVPRDMETIRALLPGRSDKSLEDRWARIRPPESETERQRAAKAAKVLKEIQAKGPLTVKQIAEALRMDVEDARKAVHGLRRSHQVERRGYTKYDPKNGRAALWQALEGWAMLDLHGRETLAAMQAHARSLIDHRGLVYAVPRP